MIFTKNVLLAHDVGSGKTIEIVAAVHELKRQDFSKKNMIVVPNNIIGQWEYIYHSMYPEAKLLVVTNKNFSTSKQEETLRKIKDDDYEAILINYSSFERIELSPDFYIESYIKDKQRINESHDDTSTNTSIIRRKFNSYKPHQLSDLYKKKEKTKDKIFFEDLKVTRLFIDEAHNYKNVPFATKMSGVKGINPTGSQKCLDTYNKVKTIQANNGGVVLATGTPITNSLADVFTLQRYLQEGELELLNISSFDAWAKMFVDSSEQFEVDVTTQNYRFVTRLNKFHNLPELSSLISSVADFYHIENKEKLPDFNGYNDVVIKKNDVFAEFLNDISARADAIRKYKPRVLRESTIGKPIYDNFLNITHDGRRGALDLRLIDPIKYDENSQTKIHECVKHVVELYEKYTSNKTTQIIFCDVSTPSLKFNIYFELKRLLISKGVEKNEIKFIHDVKNETIQENRLTLIKLF